MKRIGPVLTLLTITLTPGTTHAVWEPDPSGLKSSLGLFIQGQALLFSGGAWWAPSAKIGTLAAWDFHLEGRAGAWLLADQAAHPALAPTLQLGARVVSPELGKLGKFSSTLLGGGGFALVIDQPVAHTTLTVAKEFENRFLAIASVGLEWCVLWSPGIFTQYLGAELVWRW